MSWSAKQYVTFEQERTRPARDLLAAIASMAPRSVIDLGCGPGNSTELLVQQFDGATVRGLDSSADMIAAARQRLPDVAFEVADIGQWQEPGPFDVIFANAVLQWLPDHARLLPALVDKLAPGGSLAVQMPDTLHQPSHRLMREIAASGPWASQLAGAADTRTEVEDASTYYSILKPHCARVDVWRTTYHHPLAGGAAGVVEWFKGSGLRPFLDPLDEAQRARYLEQYLKAIEQAYPALEDGTVLLPFPRVFMVATR
ncbi:trans-aconitate 2-methyltransferase [Pseudomonas sp. NFACC32-1]|uniref:trans-aconitate 2-methyltransferase n=1 Tax=Pseudomonas TaxID=286 RepID=UPI00087673BF|nr:MULTISPECIES: trans-aconitate 2-methyltransferase [Pseudomonas]MDB6446242.1 trans-aconitate 2-methyltransferase [Pseudomonas sp. 21TX0197]MDT8906275.1 trans-aconitate 2-methyltransferase [Pseudomonas prosekii]NHN67323.1 trans-aconitate 2-methyltransferase [Pseudomonas fluorescens]ROO33591.1 trans-aconitate 2-methyltransferase [Pseudomonas sp. 7SR1]ROO37440.1 trans-aconitate 2-methyltransferase [Pseudomonas sp. AF76]